MRTITGRPAEDGMRFAADPAFDEALARIRELTGRLHAVLDLHDARRTLLGTRVCRDCGHAFPCPTVRASRAA
jgi:hypothetical protein